MKPKPRGKPFAKGLPRPANAGRRKGTPNRTTASVKAALVEAFNELGGVAALVKWGKKNPALFYPLWAKLLPQEVKVDGEKPPSVNVNLHVGVTTADLQFAESLLAGTSGALSPHGEPQPVDSPPAPPPPASLPAPG